MDFIVGLPKIGFHHESIFVVIDWLTKVAHFITRNTTKDAIIIAHKFIKEIFRLHGFPKNIILYHDSKFTSKF